MVIGLRSRKGVCRSGLAEAVPVAGDPGGGGRLVADVRQSAAYLRELLTAGR
jgi:hypothetical protein